ncbi:hypothetical protein PCANB_000742 [Pneumocystis canis]|nr:hypothetical protein PCANB_000742 [Pneumocystis canis]
MSLPPIPPRPNSPQKFSTCILQLEKTIKRAEDTSSDSLEYTVSPCFYQEQFPNTLSNDFNKHNLTKQIHYHEKDENIINASLSNAYENTDTCLTNLSKPDSKELPTLQKSNFIFVPTNPAFNTQKHTEYIYNKNYEKCIEGSHSRFNNKMPVSFCLNDYNLYQPNSMEKNNIVENKKTEKHEEETSLYSLDSFSSHKNTLKFQDKNSTNIHTNLFTKNIEDSDSAHNINLSSESVTSTNIGNESYYTGNILNVFQKFKETEEHLNLSNSEILKTDTQTTFISNNTNLDSEKNVSDNKPYEENKNILEDIIIKKKHTTISSNPTNDNTCKFKKQLGIMHDFNLSIQNIESKKKNNISQNSEYNFIKEQKTLKDENFQLTNLDGSNKPILPSRPMKKNTTPSITSHSLYLTSSNIKNRMGTQTQFSLDLEEKLKSGPPKILKPAYLKANIDENNTSSSQIPRNTKLSPEFSILEDLRKTRSKGPSRRKPTIITTESQKKLEFSNIMKLFDIIKDETLENSQKNNIKLVIKDNSDIYSIEDSTGNNMQLTTISSSNILDTFSAITFNN